MSQFVFIDDAPKDVITEMEIMRFFLFILSGLILISANAVTQNSPTTLSKDTPIEIVSDALEVLQNEHKAIFTGNVIATQGTINMRAQKMTVYYREDSPNDPSEPAEAAALGKGIYRIESQGKVFFTTPQETAQGDTAIYYVDTNTINLENNVYLTRGKNVLKGSKLTYNLTSGRSVLTGGSATTQTTGRVRGLFVPGNNNPATNTSDSGAR